MVSVRLIVRGADNTSEKGGSGGGVGAGSSELDWAIGEGGDFSCDLEAERTFQTYVLTFIILGARHPERMDRPVLAPATGG